MKRIRADDTSSKNQEDDVLPDFPVDLMLDSGAFSAWTHGQEIKVQDYIGFVKQYGHFFDSIVNLDVIPGKFGKKRSPRDTERAVEQSYENLQAMKEAGIKAIPVFHQDENFKYLERMLEDGEEYIGISPSGDRISMHDDWFRDVFHLITDDDGNPVVKTHGFGVTSVPIMMKYPWYSMDSVTWVIKSGYGCIFVPPWKRGWNPDYYENPISVWVTGEARKNARFEFELLGEELGKWCSIYFEKHLGISKSRIRYNAYARMEAMASYFHEIRKRLVYAPFREHSGSLIRMKSDRAAMKWPMKNMIFAVGPLSNTKRSDILNSFGIKKRLVSYFDLREINPEEIRKYKNHGIVRSYNMKYPRQKWDSSEYLNFRRVRLAEHVRMIEESMHEDLER